MAQDTWLALTDYSNKYDVSISTLRRRIKADKAEYQFDNGKYVLKDKPLKQHWPSPKNAQSQEVAKPSSSEVKTSSDEPSSQVDESKEITREYVAPPQEDNDLPGSSETEDNTEQKLKASTEKGELSQEGPVLSTAAKLLDELKKAYRLILQEKEEQIIQLKDEMTDLKTLVRVLEDENNRLKETFSQRHRQPQVQHSSEKSMNNANDSSQPDPRQEDSTGLSFEPLFEPMRDFE